MSTTPLVAVALIVVVALVAAARGLDARAARQARRRADVAGSYLAEAGLPSQVYAHPLPRWFAVAVMVAAGGGVAGAVVGIASRSADERQSRSDEIAGCRSSFSIELLSGPQAEGLAALAATGSLDSPEFAAAVDRLDVDRMQELSVMSRTDPDEFLAICRARTRRGR